MGRFFILLMVAFLIGCGNSGDKGIETGPGTGIEGGGLNTGGQGPSPGGSRNQQGQRIITFFYIVNETGQDIKVKVLGDDRVIVVQEVGFERDLSSGVQVAPPPGKYPGRELKVVMDRDTKVFEIQELNSGIRKKFDLKGVGRVNGGFRITIRENQIFLNPDYFPIR